MHARYVRVWAAAGLGATALAVPLTLWRPSAGPTLLVVGLSYLALALALGLLPAFARRDWPSPVFAWAAVLLGALGVAALPAPRASFALLGASLVVGALQPLALLLSPRWAGARETDEHRPADLSALAALGLSLAGVLAGGLLLIALPRMLPHAALAALLLGGVLPAAFGALVFLLPRAAGAPLRGATLVHAALLANALAAGALAWSFARPFGADLRLPVALVALAFALAVTALLRVPRPLSTRPLVAGAFALAILTALALLLATLGGLPNALLPAALFAAFALAAVLLAAALASGAPLLLPGRASEGRWRRYAPALLIAALFLYTPALQLDRSPLPAALVGGAGLLWLLAGLSGLLRTRD